MIVSRKRVWIAGVSVLVSVGVLALSVDVRGADKAKADSARIAAVKHIMKGVHGPSCGDIANALKDGPKDDKAWAELALNAALLNESGHLLMQNNRCPDGVWAKATAELRKGSNGVYAAAGRKDVDAARAAFKTVTAACGACHAKHKKKPAAPAGRLASIKHLMSGINGPNCAAIGKALKGGGPADDKAWEQVVRNAALLNEAGFLLMQNNRCPDGTWKDATAALRNNSAKVAQAAMSKKLEEARTGFKGVTAACGTCHKAHKKPV